MGKNRGVSHIHREVVAERDGWNCHFCLKITFKRGDIGPKSRRLRTIDHVVPVSWGGKNSLDNYVIACAGCNDEKGNNLFYCRCEHCSKIIESFMKTSAYRNNMKVFKPKVKRVFNHRSPKHTWMVKAPGCEKKFVSYNEALSYALMQMGGRLKAKS